MATKNYMINDKWLDINKKNIVELQSVDGVLDSLKVNGSEIVTPSGKITITENGTDIDIAQYATADVNVEGGGGSWQTVYEGSVTTAEDEGHILGEVSSIEQISADVLKITFNGVEYECEKIIDGTSNIYGGVGEDGPDFQEYPFTLVSTEEYTILYTETAGTYTLKIEEPQSGGSSDFSTAEVTITNNSGEKVGFYLPVYMNIPEYGAIIQGFMMTDSEEPTFEGEVVIPTNGELYVGSTLAQFTTSNTTVTGNARVENGQLVITGDCTITIS